MSRFSARNTVLGVIEISDQMHPAHSLIIYGEESANNLIDLLKKAKAKAWPKPLKPLCPASVELLGYLRKYGDVTPLKAREELGIEHLPRRIKDLKEHGHPVVTKMKRGHAGKRYAHYSLLTPTARTSAGEPNVQPIPVRTPEGSQIRQAFIEGNN